MIGAAAGADPSQSLVGIYEGSDRESDLVDDFTAAGFTQVQT